MKKRSAILAIFIVVALFAVFVSASASDYDKSQQISAIGYGHTDTMWEWPFHNTVDYVHDSYLNAVNLINANNNYKFSTTTAKHFTFLDEYYPELMQKVKLAYSNGKIGIASGWVESDAVMPSAEALIRQNLYAQEYYQKTFSAKASTMVLPDDFGLGYILPQICKATGFNNLVTRRSAPTNTDMFHWVGVDGTSILAYKPTPWYNSVTPKADIKAEADFASSIGIKKGMYLAGYGDKGGGPTQNTINQLNEANENIRYPSAKWDTFDQFFASLTNDDLSKVTATETNLLYGNCIGTYTTQAEIKKYNRFGEIGLDNAERLSTIADWLGASAYPVKPLSIAWDKILTNQFHDILPGTCTNDANVDAYNDYNIAMNLINQCEDVSINGIISKANTQGDGIPLVIFNPLSVKRTDVAEKDVVFDSTVVGVKVFDQSGTEVPVQIVSRSGNKAKIVFEVKDLPSLGYAVYHAIPVNKIQSYNSYNTGLKSTPTSLENNNLSIKINPKTGNICSLVDKKQNNKEMLQNGKEVEMQLMKDDSNAWDLSYSDLMDDPILRLNTADKIALIENGPVRSIIRVTRTVKSSRSSAKSSYSQDIVLTAASNRADLPTTVNWKEKNVTLKANIPMAASALGSTLDYSNGVGFRAINSGNGMERFGHMWADITDISGIFGMSVLNDSKYGWDMPSNKQLRLTLLRSCRSQDKTADIGVHSFTYSLYPHSGNWQSANTPQEAHYLNYPITVTQTTNHTGTLGKSFSFISVDKPNVLITAVKDSEESINNYNDNSSSYNNKMTFRITETLGAENTDVKITTASGIKSAIETNMLEEKTGEASFIGSTISTNIKKYQIKTFVLQLESPNYKIDRPKIINADLSQAYNIRGISANGEIVQKGMAIKKTFPAEKFSGTIISNNIPFKLGSVTKDTKNAVEACGQDVLLPSGGYKKMFLLACAAGDGNDHEQSLVVNYKDGTSQNVKINFLDWNKYTYWTDPSITTPIAASLNHYHYNGDDVVESRVNAYLYSIDLIKDKEVSSISLPDDEMVKILAVSLGDNYSVTVKPTNLITNNNDNSSDINTDELNNQEITQQPDSSNSTETKTQKKPLRIMIEEILIWPMVVIILGSLLLVGGGIFVFLKIRKKKLSATQL